MDTFVLDDALPVADRDGIVTKFYTSSAWVEDRAEQQLKQISGWPGMRRIAAFPDLHPGKYGPLGCAALADRIYPQLIGNDIGCGMSLFQLDTPLRKFKLDWAARRIRCLGERSDENYADHVERVGLKPDQYTSALGTIGGGNHFCEVQSVAEQTQESSLDKTRLHLLIHSGSRGMGAAVFGSLPPGAFAGMPPEDEATRAYLHGHDMAVRWARLNRQIIAERAARALRADVRLIADAPHNMLTLEEGGWLHRKGAAVATDGAVPLAGSRATPSYLLRPEGLADALGSTAHGAGRRYDRSSMHGRVRAKRSDIAGMERTPFGGRVICEDRDLMVEEAPHAYKNVQSVVRDLQDTGVAEPIAVLYPLLTYKKIRTGGEA